MGILAEKFKNAQKVVNFGIEVKAWEDLKTFDDVWGVLPDGCVVLLKGRDFVTTEKDDVYWQEVMRRALKAPRAEHIFHCVYRQNKNDFWEIIIRKKREEKTINLEGNGGVIEIRAPGHRQLRTVWTRN